MSDTGSREAAAPGDGEGLDRSQLAGPLRVEPPLGRGSFERSPVPGRPAPVTAHPDEADAGERFAGRTLQVPLSAAIAIVATIVIGQLWALTVALDAWLSGDDDTARWIVAFQAASFAVALLTWFATPRRR
jgi:hypothetical protein